MEKSKDKIILDFGKNNMDVLYETGITAFGLNK